jgi:hypothetical protein
MSIKIASRDFRAKLKQFDLNLWAKDHVGTHKGHSTTFIALPKEVFEAGTIIVNNSTSDSSFWNESLLSPKLFFEPKYLRVWRLILSLPKIPQGIALYQNRVYEISEPYPDEELKLTILEIADKERKKFERLKAKFDPRFAQSLQDQRVRIEEEVRVFVWRRDQGRCAKCGSRNKLEYDHIIPLSKGGGNSARNIELLCETCNRLKSANV